MKKSLMLLLLCLLAAVTASAQNTVTVSGTVAEVGGTAWQDGTYTFTFVGPSSSTWPGGGIPRNLSGILSGTGTYSQNVPNNNTITPGPTFWNLTVCPNVAIANAAASCFTLSNQTISGAGGVQTLNVTPPALVIAPGAGQVAYASAEISPGSMGAQFFLYKTGLQVCTAGTATTCSTYSAVGGGGGSVTSVGLTMPAEFTVAGSPVTTSGTLGVSKATQTANTVWAGPNTGVPAVPTFRSLVAADIPVGLQPAGATNTIQYNNAGAFGGLANFSQGFSGNIIVASGGFISDSTGAQGVVWTATDLQLSAKGGGIVNAVGFPIKANAYLTGGSPSVSGCSLSGSVGGQSAGKFTSGVSGACTVTITLPSTTNGWVCDAHDVTTAADANNMVQTNFATASAILSGTTVTGDVILWKCQGM